MHHLETLIQSIPTSLFEAVARGVSDPAQSSLDVASSHSNLLGFTGPITYPSGVPPPSLSTSSLTNPSTHFSPSGVPVSFNAMFGPNAADSASEVSSKVSLSHSYLYFDEQGCKRWQGETSGLPLLDLLSDRGAASTPGDWPNSRATPPAFAAESPSELEDSTLLTTGEWFPDRVTRHMDINPETLWKVITSCISPDLMDTYVQSSVACSKQW